MKYKVMIVEDQTMPRELFELRIQSSERFEVAISIDNAAMADIYCLRIPVDLILMDVITRGGESGLEAAARIKRAFPQIKIVIVTSMPECSYLDRARAIGIESFWYKEDPHGNLLDIMERTMNGESVYLNLWSDIDPTEMANRIRQAMYAAGFSIVEESDRGYNQPEYDTATRQYAVQWTWCLRTEVPHVP